MASLSHGHPSSKGLLHETNSLTRRDHGMTSSKRRFRGSLYLEANERMMRIMLLFPVKKRETRKLQVESQLHKG